MNYMYLSILSHTLNVPDLCSSKVTTVSFTDSTVTKKGTYPPLLRPFLHHTISVHVTQVNQRHNFASLTITLKQQNKANTSPLPHSLPSPSSPFIFPPTFD